VNAFSSGATTGRTTANSASSAGGAASRLASQPNAARPPHAAARMAAVHDRILFMRASLAFAGFPGNGNGRRKNSAPHVKTTGPRGNQRLGTR